MCSGTRRKVENIIVLDLVVEKEIEVITLVDESAVVKGIVVEVGVEIGIEILLIDVNEAKAVKEIGILLVIVTEAVAKNVEERGTRSSQAETRSLTMYIAMYIYM